MHARHVQGIQQAIDHDQPRVCLEVTRSAMLAAAYDAAKDGQTTVAAQWKLAASCIGGLLASRDAALLVG